MTTDRGTGSVYPTNVPGVGVAISTSYPASGSYALLGQSSVQLKYNLTRTSAGDYGTGSFSGGYNLIGIMLVKTGDIKSGAVVNASSFPSFVIEAHAMPGYSGLPVSLLSGSFTGTSQFITQTCTTPANTTIDLGSYNADGFTKAGGTTRWVDSSIILQNCPKFAGYYGLGGSNAPATIDSGGVSGGTRALNIFTISLAPTNSVSGNVIALDSDTNAATGLGLQIGYSPNDVDASATSPAAIWTSGTRWNVTAPTDGRSIVKIPLAARYYQTADTVTPGIANAKVVFNIDYK